MTGRVDRRVRKSTARSRFLGAQLRARREAAGWTQPQMARRMGWVATTISRIETGSGRVATTNLITYLAVCGIVGADQAALIALADGYLDDWWLCPHGAVGPDELSPLRFTCTTADSIAVYHPGSVPDLLQSQEFSCWLHGPDEVQARLGRQQVLYRRTPCDWTFYLPESLLHTLPGPPEVRGDQLMHLALLIMQHHIDIRVLPTGAEHQLSSVGGRFWLFGFADHQPTVCVQNDTVSMFGERDADVVVYQQIVRELDALALPDRQSADLILQLANAAPPAVAGH
ncbi:MAG TPA: helix-turn-helix transcriptional regulator [Pseudonocardiaceae bacterium]|jgi:transcriptional regulator with XRE-family HTH domain|nr:helix-turn-helix transcriptional regulator [Pseudonocardiaceae bacterium]